MSATPPAKESLCLVIDTTANARPHLEAMQRTVKELIVNKIFHSKQDVVGILGHGTEGTNHSVAEDEETEDGQYPHITELHKMFPVSCQTLGAVHEATAIEPHAADLVDSLCVAMFAVIQHVRKLKFSKRVVLITDGTSRCNVDDDQLRDIATQLSDQGMRVEVYGAGFDLDAADEYEAAAEGVDADDDDGSDAGQPMSTQLVAARRARTCQFLSALSSEVNQAGGSTNALGEPLFAFAKLADAAAAISALQRKSVRSTTTFRGALAIGPSLGLPVWSFKKVVTTNAPAMKTVSKSALERLEGEGGGPVEETTKTEKRYILQSAPDADVPPDLHVPAFRFGRDLVPVSGAILEKMKYGVDQKVLQLVGIVPDTEIPRHLLVSTAECVFADPATVGDAAFRGLQALLMVLDEQSLVCLARYASRKGAQPRMVALWPSARSFWLLQLPFEDELKMFDWGPPSTVPPPTTLQVRAAKDLIDAMDLCPEGDEGDDLLLPKSVFNPKIRRFLQCIASRALAAVEGAAGGTSLLPPPDWRVTRPLTLDSEVRERSEGALEAFAAACPLEEATSGGKRKAVAGTRGRGADKRLRDGNGTHGTEAELRPQTTQLAPAVPSAIDTGNLVPSFWMMLEDEQTDRTAAAMGGMRDAITNLLGACSDAADQHAETAYRALREFRKAAVMYEEPNLFNETLRTLKGQFAGAPGAVWGRIRSDEGLKGGLITGRESEESDVNEEQAAQFWAPEGDAAEQGLRGEAASARVTQNDCQAGPLANEDDDMLYDDLE